MIFFSRVAHYTRAHSLSLWGYTKWTRGLSNTYKIVVHSSEQFRSLFEQWWIAPLLVTAYPPKQPWKAVRASDSAEWCLCRRHRIISTYKERPYSIMGNLLFKNIVNVLNWYCLDCGVECFRVDGSFHICQAKIKERKGSIVTWRIQ